MIREVRIEKGLSQNELAFRIGMKQPDISMIEKGRKNITLETLARLCKITFFFRYEGHPADWRKDSPLLDMQMGKFILVLSLAVLFLSGCATEYNLATRQEEWIFYSTEKEVNMGKSIARAVEKEYELADDPLVQKRVRDIGKKIVSVCDRQEIDYQFKVIEEEEVNAFALPGGFVYVTSGLIDKVENDDELACVLAHEVGHIVARHSVKKLQAAMGYNLLRILIAQAPEGGKVITGADIAFVQIMAGYSREDELLADQLGTRYAKRAGFNPEAMISFLQKLQEITRRKPLHPKSYIKTHPYVPDRIRVVKQELGKPLTFDDYINIEQKPHGQ